MESFNLDAVVFGENDIATEAGNHEANKKDSKLNQKKEKPTAPVVTNLKVAIMNDIMRYVDGKVAKVKAGVTFTPDIRHDMDELIHMLSSRQNVEREISQELDTICKNIDDLMEKLDNEVKRVAQNSFVPTDRGDNRSSNEKIRRIDEIEKQEIDKFNKRYNGDIPAGLLNALKRKYSNMRASYKN